MMGEQMIFQEFPKIARLSRDCTITEKIDGTNASIYISDDSSEFLVGSRTRWITPEKDNFGFAKWAYEHREELVIGLGPGHHFGEWWGLGIQRGYGLSEKRFSLFNSLRWCHSHPVCCGIVPIIYTGPFVTEAVDSAIANLRLNGSFANPGYDKPEGIVIYHHAARISFKKTLEKDDKHKGEQ